MLEPGAKLPPFSLADQTGTAKTLRDLTGPRGLVMYVYPKDMTPGCTLESQNFRDLLGAFRVLGFNVAGLSQDGVESHCRFAEKENLNFSLLADPERALIGPLGAWGEKKNYGRAYMGIIRSTVVVDAAGVVLRAYAGVKVAGHALRVLKDVEALVRP